MDGFGNIGIEKRETRVESTPNENVGTLSGWQRRQVQASAGYLCSIFRVEPRVNQESD